MSAEKEFEVAQSAFEVFERNLENWVEDLLDQDRGVIKTYLKQLMRERMRLINEGVVSPVDLGD